MRKEAYRTIDPQTGRKVIVYTDGALELRQSGRRTEVHGPAPIIPKSAETPSRFSLREMWRILRIR